MRDRWAERLSEYLDGDLEAPERAELDQHLAQCAACRQTLDDLRAVRHRAARLEDRAPPRDLWSGIAERIAAKREPHGPVIPIQQVRSGERRRFSLTIPQLAAAGVALMLISGGLVQVAHWSRPANVPSPAAELTLESVPDVAVVGFDVRTFEGAVAELEHVLERHRQQLDSVTVRVVEQNVAVIDRAITDARAALARDPANEYLSRHLAETMRQKVRLLQRAAFLATAAS